MSIALDSRLFALSLFHLCSCNICHFFLIQSKVTEQINMTIESATVCWVEFATCPKKKFAQGRLLRCGALNCSFHAPSPSGLSRGQLETTCLETAPGKRTHKNCFQLPTSSNHLQLQMAPDHSAETPLLQQSFQISNSVWQSLSI